VAERRRRGTDPADKSRDDELDDKLIEELEADSDLDEDVDDVADDELDDEEDEADEDEKASKNGRKTAVKDKDKADSKKKSKETDKKAKTKEGARPGIFGRFANFFREVVGELRKVIWPTRKELFTYTAVVVVFVTIMLTVVGLLDFGFAKLVLLVFGNKTVAADPTTGS
jgi:preprotein translocase subunit SecE